MAQFFEVTAIRLDGRVDHCEAYESLEEATAHFERERERSGYATVTLHTYDDGEREQVRSCTFYP